MIPGNQPTAINNDVSFCWPEQGFSYLGIIITPHSTQLFSSNYNKLITQVKSDLACWEILSLSLSLLDRVETRKMNLLP